MVTTAKTVKHGRLITILGSRLVFWNSAEKTRSDFQKTLLVSRGSSTSVCTLFSRQMWRADWSPRHHQHLSQYLELSQQLKLFIVALLFEKIFRDLPVAPSFETNAQVSTESYPAPTVREELVAKTSAGLLPFTLGAPLLSMFHSVNFTALLGLSSWTTHRTTLDRQSWRQSFRIRRAHHFARLLLQRSVSVAGRPGNTADPRRNGNGPCCFQ